MSNDALPLALVEPSVAARWNAIFERGGDKAYPTLDLVRLERWYWGGHQGRVLEYGFGSGANLVHLLKGGHEVDAIDVSPAARAMVEKKLANLAPLGRVRLSLLAPDAQRLPYEDGIFDYVCCLSVLSLLASRPRVEKLLGEFLRVMKPGAKLIADINSPNSDFARGSEQVGDGVYLFRGLSGTDAPVPTYCPSTASEFAALFSAFRVDDVGYSAYKYGPSEILEYIVCASRPSATDIRATLSEPGETT